MPIDLSGLIESLQRGLGEIPPIAVGLALLAGPTLALVGYRLLGVARRMKTVPEVEAEPFWVCKDCRSVNELRLSHCYRCDAKRDAVGDIEVILDRPTGAPATFEVPAGSPFAALGANRDLSNRGAHVQDPGSPVMAGGSRPSDPIAVGPGRPGVEAAGDDLAAVAEGGT